MITVTIIGPQESFKVEVGEGTTLADLADHLQENWDDVFDGCDPGFTSGDLDDVDEWEVNGSDGWDDEEELEDEDKIRPLL